MMPQGLGATAPGAWAWIARHGRLVFPFLLVAAVLVVVVPLPAPLLDLLLAANITLAMVVLLSSVYVHSPLEFSVFPSLLLTATLLRLVLNVASTRLILTRAADHGTLAAGRVIHSFGEFVAADRVAVGLVIFFILVVIQFVVITKGATRISEVAARFALDALPGRQMAVDADLSAGLIDQDQARSNRDAVSRQADFYSAMDGACKFVRGDAVAAMVIIGVNIVGGLYVGIVEAGMSLGQAVEVFTKLTIGDGLVAQVPALLISLAAALIVTRNSSKTDLPREIIGQLVAHPQALAVAAVFLGILAFTQLPRAPLLVLGLSCAAGAYLLSRPSDETPAGDSSAQERAQSQHHHDPVEGHLHARTLELEIGFGLIRLADAGQGNELLQRIAAVRKHAAQQLGILLPKVRIRDNLRLNARDYVIKIRDVEVAVGSLEPERLLACAPAADTPALDGADAVHPTRPGRACWIDPDQRPHAQQLGYTVLAPTDVLAEHLTDVVGRHADQLLSREQVKQLLDRLRATSPSVVDEVVPDLLRVADVQEVLAGLLRERIPIRNLEAIMESLGRAALVSKQPGVLLEHVRASLAPIISRQFRDETKTLRAVVLEPALEEQIARQGATLADGFADGPSPFSVWLVRELERRTRVDEGAAPVVLCGAAVRPRLRRLTASALPELAVVSRREVTPDTTVEVCASIAAAQQNQGDIHRVDTAAELAPHTGRETGRTGGDESVTVAGAAQ
jgi:flagellar biosynthesis protein FlhA